MATMGTNRVNLVELARVLVAGSAPKVSLSQKDIQLPIEIIKDPMCKKNKIKKK